MQLPFPAASFPVAAVLTEGKEKDKMDIRKHVGWSIQIIVKRGRSYGAALWNYSGCGNN